MYYLYSSVSANYFLDDLRPMTKKITGLIIYILTFSTTEVFSQATLDSKKVTTEKELNFAFTDKRGIKGDNGVIYFVDNGGRTLTAYDNETIKWTADVLGYCGLPAVGKPAIRYIKLTAEKIEITFGKHNFASVDIADGKVKCLGAD